MLRRLIRIVLGFALLGAGLILLVPGVPGPGLPMTVAGLVLLSKHFRWAQRALGWMKKRVARMRRKARSRREQRAS